jgi:hypothetical protein
MNQYFNKDIMDWDVFPEYDLLYTDPPWGVSLVKQFATMQEKQTGTRPVISFYEIMNKLAKCADITKPLVIEYAIKGYLEVKEIMIEHVHTFNRTDERIQSMGRPFVIMSFNCNLQLSKEVKGFNIIKETVQSLNAHTVFDPFAGIGNTAKAVTDAGATYIGSEINPARYARLIKVKP